MELSAELFSAILHGPAWVIFLLALLAALRMACWRRLSNKEQFNVFLGTCVVLILLWLVRAQVEQHWSYHLLGVTAVTLMFGWSLAIIATTIALTAVTFNGGGDWQGLALNGLLVGVLPVTLTQFSLVLVHSLLPRNFFVYVLLNAFLIGGLAATLCGYAAALLLATSGVYTWFQLEQELLPFFPLMFLPEALINGWIITMLVLYRPAWVGSFSDVLYLKGK